MTTSRSMPPVCRRCRGPRRLTPYYRRVTGLTDAEIKFGLIPKDDWYMPEWIDKAKAAASREKMQADNVIYGGAFYS